MTPSGVALLALRTIGAGTWDFIVSHLRNVFGDLSRDTALVIVEQNLPLVCAIATRVYAIKDGRVVAQLSGKDAITPQACEPYL